MIETDWILDDFRVPYVSMFWDNPLLSLFLESAGPPPKNIHFNEADMQRLEAAGCSKGRCGFQARAN